MVEKDLEKQLSSILKGVEDVILLDELKILISNSIKYNKPLNIKLGLDPTAPDIHLGHTVVLTKLRQFQDLGHKAILIIGDFTARIGDPSGRSALRPSLSPEKIEENAKTYMSQAFKILDESKTEVIKNSTWFEPLKFSEVLNITSRFTIARMLERDDFKKRFSSNLPITIMEFLYPLMQAYDSVAINADVELGGTDQRFNLLMGRELQKEYGQKPQIAITMPILVGLDGVQKMSKSLGNYIGVSENPNEIFGKIMSIPDNIMIDYFNLLTRLTKEEITKIKNDMENGSLNPSIAKRKLASIIVENLYDYNTAKNAEDNFNKIFKEKSIPDDVNEYVINKKDYPSGKIKIISLLNESKLCSSNSEAKRIIEQGGLKIDNNKVSDINLELNIDELNSKIIQKGKRYFLKVIVK
ncbi:MAG: tyrosine--tRNA ligase [Actinobacteria bacterium]|nr:tyrosine--tRNA ligase [Cyanobacteriota bacterium]MCL5772229.1 tyrosine--tRNA ligase [Actinomycetota bacterium]